VLAEEGQRAVPRQRRRIRVVLGAVLLEEPVARAGIAVEGDLELVEVQLRLEEGHRVLVDVRVGLREVAEVGGAGTGEVDVLGAVEDGGGDDVLRHAGRHPQGHRRTHREAEDPDRAVRGQRHVPQGHEAGARQVGQLVGVGRDELLLGVVDGGRHPAAEQVGGQGHEAGFGQPVADGPEHGVEAPPGVQHEDAWSLTALGDGQVAGAGSSGIHHEHGSGATDR
jgi:hypothetical protein